MSNRRTFLLSTAGLISSGLAVSPAIAANEKAPMTPKAALQNLMEGNARFVAGNGRCTNLTARVLEVAHGQWPFATILGCSDSRVPVETVFDHEPGDIFVVRVAGNFVTTEGLGSIEYAVAVLKSPLVMVLGHTSCGAVKAATEFVKEGKQFPGAIQSLAEAIAPAARKAEAEKGDWVHASVIANVHANVNKLKSDDSLVSKAAKAGEIDIVGAVYDLHTGKVSLL